MKAVSAAKTAIVAAAQSRRRDLKGDASKVSDGPSSAND